MSMRDELSSMLLPAETGALTQRASTLSSRLRMFMAGSSLDLRAKGRRGGPGGAAPLGCAPGLSSGRDDHQLDGLEVGHVATNAPAGVELDEGLRRVGVHQRRHAEAVDDGVAGAEVAERDRQRAGLHRG